jgi:hypothetical protein
VISSVNSIEVVDMGFPVLATQFAATVCTSRFEMRPHLRYLILRRVGINRLAQCMRDVILGLRQEMITDDGSPPSGMTR